MLCLAFISMFHAAFTALTLLAVKIVVMLLSAVENNTYTETEKHQKNNLNKLYSKKKMSWQLSFIADGSSSILANLGTTFSTVIH